MKYAIYLLILGGLLYSVSSIATPTTIVIRTKAKDAKFIGSSIGGAHIIIREEATGEVLAKGFTQGSTGNTDLIMRKPKERYQPISEESTSKFEVTLNIDKPTFVTIEATAPFNQKQSAIKASTQLWLIPGKNILGDGVILEIPGFVVNVLAPQTHQFVTKEMFLDGMIPVKANVVMMCGCTISNKGLWDGEKITVEAWVYLNGELLHTVPMRIFDHVNTFEGGIPFVAGGNYEVHVIAYDARTGNTGVDKVNFIVEN